MPGACCSPPFCHRERWNRGVSSVARARRATAEGARSFGAAGRDVLEQTFRKRKPASPITGLHAAFLTQPHGNPSPRPSRAGKSACRSRTHLRPCTTPTCRGSGCPHVRATRGRCPDHVIYVTQGDCRSVVYLFNVFTRHPVPGALLGARDETERRKTRPAPGPGDRCRLNVCASPD